MQTPQDTYEIVEEAPAKVNLGLLIERRRDDSFHDLVSVFHAVSWCDTISIRPTSFGVALTCSDESLPTGEGNLVYKAAALFLDHFGVRDGVRVHLAKSIPYGAGLGGGSSDAAATLRAMAQAFEVHAPDEVWLDLCARLGSDVPFFHRGGTALVEGRGEIITPIRTDEDLALVVAVPPVHVATPWAYRQLSPPFADTLGYRDRIADLQTARTSLTAFCDSLDNTFQPVVERAHPAIAELREALDAAGALSSLMSGSGSAVFGVFDSCASAQAALATLPSGTNARAMRSHRTDAGF